MVMLDGHQERVMGCTHGELNTWRCTACGMALDECIADLRARLAAAEDRGLTLQIAVDELESHRRAEDKEHAELAVLLAAAERELHEVRNAVNSLIEWIRTRGAGQRGVDDALYAQLQDIAARAHASGEKGGA
jgi:hypothetical protein